MSLRPDHPDGHGNVPIGSRACRGLSGHIGVGAWSMKLITTVSSNVQERLDIGIFLSRRGQIHNASHEVATNRRIGPSTSLPNALEQVTVRGNFAGPQ